MRAAKDFEAYAVYVSNFNTAIGTLAQLRVDSKVVDAAIEKCEQASTNDFTLNELLSFPLNRVAEYAVTFEAVALAAQDARQNNVENKGDSIELLIVFDNIVIFLLLIIC